jgi:hypothetical protein
MGKRLRLTGNYVDGKLTSVTLSKGQGSFSMPVRDEHDSAEERASGQSDNRRLTFREWARREDERLQG